MMLKKVCCVLALFCLSGQSPRKDIAEGNVVHPFETERKLEAPAPQKREERKSAAKRSMENSEQVTKSAAKRAMEAENYL